ncbi:MAG: cyclic nucleotide-binding/CBS domain-containing protein [Acidimicrobiales bacterium]
MATLGDVMSADVATLDAEATLSEAAQAMVRGRFGSILVMHGNHVAGIFTERDVLRAAAKAADVATETVSAWMTADPIVASPDDHTETAADLMLSNGFRHLPVVDQSGLVGIVSLRDVLSARIGRS